MDSLPCSRCESISVPSEEDYAKLSSFHSLMLELANSFSPVKRQSPTISSQEIALNINELLTSRNCTQQDLSLLRMLLVGVNEKLKLIDLFQEKITDLTAKIKISVKKRETVHVTGKETLTEIGKKRKQQELFTQKLTDQRNLLKQELAQQLELYHGKCDQETELRSKFKQLNSAFTALQGECANFEQMKNLITEQQRLIEKTDTERAKLNEKYKYSLREYEKNKEEQAKENCELMNNNEALGEQLAISQGLVQDLRGCISENTRTIHQRDAEIKQLESQVTSLSDQASKAQQMQELAHHTQATCDQLNLQIQQNGAQQFAELQKLDLEKRNFLEKLENAFSTITVQERQIKSLDGAVAAAELEKQNLSADISLLNSHLTVHQGRAAAVKSLDAFKNLKSQLIQEIYQEMDETVSFISSQSDKALDQQKLIDKLQFIAQEKSAEVLNLRSTVAALQKAKGYQAVKDDTIDVALGKYLNARPVPLEVPFVRTDAGVYLFGSKKITIKLEQARVIIRVGGGYMGIDQFIDTYLPVEADKMLAKGRPKSRKPTMRLVSSFVEEAVKGRAELTPMKTMKVDMIKANSTSLLTQKRPVVKAAERRGTKRTATSSNNF